MRSPQSIALRHEPAAWATAHTLNACAGCLHACGQAQALRCRQAEVAQANDGVADATRAWHSSRGCNHHAGPAGVGDEFARASTDLQQARFATG